MLFFSRVLLRLLHLWREGGRERHPVTDSNSLEVTSHFQNGNATPGVIPRREAQSDGLVAFAGCSSSSSLDGLLAGLC